MKRVRTVLVGAIGVSSGCMLGPTAVGDVEGASGDAGGTIGEHEGSAGASGGADETSATDGSSGGDATTGCIGECADPGAWVVELSGFDAQLAFQASGELLALSHDLASGGVRLDRFTPTGGFIDTEQLTDVPSGFIAEFVIAGDHVGVLFDDAPNGYSVQRRSADVRTATWTTSEPGLEALDAAWMAAEDLTIASDGQFLVAAEYLLDDIPPILPYYALYRRYGEDGARLAEQQRFLEGEASRFAFMTGPDVVPWLWRRAARRGIELDANLDLGHSRVPKVPVVLVDAPVRVGDGWAAVGAGDGSSGFAITIVDATFHAVATRYDEALVPVGVTATNDGFAVFARAGDDGPLQLRRYDAGGSLLATEPVAELLDGASPSTITEIALGNDGSIFAVCSERTGGDVNRYTLRRFAP